MRRNHNSDVSFAFTSLSEYLYVSMKWLILQEGMLQALGGIFMRSTQRFWFLGCGLAWESKGSSSGYSYH